MELLRLNLPEAYDVVRTLPISEVASLCVEGIQRILAPSPAVEEGAGARAAREAPVNVPFDRAQAIKDFDPYPDMGNTVPQGLLNAYGQYKSYYAQKKNVLWFQQTGRPLVTACGGCGMWLEDIIAHRNHFVCPVYLVNKGGAHKSSSSSSSGKPSGDPRCCQMMPKVVVTWYEENEAVLREARTRKASLSLVSLSASSQRASTSGGVAALLAAAKARK